MNMYASFDYLCNEPFYLNGIGHAVCPTLRDIRKITYQLFSLYLSLLSMSREEYLRLYGLPESCDDSLYHLLLYGNTQLLFGILSFFLTGQLEFEKETGCFAIYETADGGGQTLAGHIGEDNFEEFRLEMQHILGIKKPEETGPKFKNSLAQNLFQKMQTHTEQLKQKADKNFELDNMVRKYCTNNKVGISILNVWDMTYYQFTCMFAEYCNARQCDFNDNMAANTFSYKKSSDYQPMEYMKRI